MYSLAVNPLHSSTLYAGTGEKKNPTDSAPLAGSPLYGPRAIAVDAKGDLIVVLREGNAIYRIDARTQTIHHFAGTGEKGLARFKGKGSEYVWKDTYVFVSDCNKRTTVAHPTMPERDGKPIAAGPTYGGVTAAQRADAQCEAARKPGGDWFEYPFPKPGEERPSRKVTYMLAVPGTPYVVGAGVYDETVTLGELETASGGRR